jgi:hypothetical protein
LLRPRCVPSGSAQGPRHCGLDLSVSQPLLPSRLVQPARSSRTASDGNIGRWHEANYRRQVSRKRSALRSNFTGDFWITS